jgi:hypothetical protein
LPVILAVGAAVVLAMAVWAPVGRAPARVAQVAAVQLTTDDGRNALFAVSDLAPDHPVTRCLQVSYDGPGGSGSIRLAASDITGRLAAHLAVTVAVGTGGGFTSCAGFTGKMLYTGWLTGLATGTAGAPGVPGGWTPDGPGTRTYQFTVTLQGDDSQQGATSTATFEWLLVDSPLPEPTTPAPIPTTSPTPTPAPPPPTPAPPTTAPGPAPPSRSSPASPSATPTTVPLTPSPPPSAPARVRTGGPTQKPSSFVERAQRQVEQLVVGTYLAAKRLVTKDPSFPAILVVLLVAFLAVQDRIDRRDPKLALARMISEPDLTYEDPSMDETVEPAWPARSEMS